MFLELRKVSSLEVVNQMLISEDEGVYELMGSVECGGWFVVRHEISLTNSILYSFKMEGTTIIKVVEKNISNTNQPLFSVCGGFIIMSYAKVKTFV